MEKYSSIIEFLIKAKKSTYAGKGPERPSCRPPSHDLAYSEGELMYLDSFLGGGKFAGEEAVWLGGVPYWSMNYAGRVIGEDFSGDFLKEALLRVPFEKPFRGPEMYSDGKYTYLCRSEGDFEWFCGYEAIYLGEQKIYECYFHGSIIE